MNRLLFLIAFFIPLAACTETSRASDVKTDIQVGQCRFSLPTKSKGHFNKIQGSTVSLAYNYDYNGRTYKASVDLRCSNHSLQQSLMDDFQKEANGWTINIGSEGGSRTLEIKKKYWHGLRTKYYLGSPCVYFIGTSGKLNSFTLNICDSEETLPPQLKILDTILSELEPK